MDDVQMMEVDGQVPVWHFAAVLVAASISFLLYSPLSHSLVAYCKRTGHRGHYEDIDFDPAHNDTLDRFEAIRQHSYCIYAKGAKLWGAPTYDERLSLDNNVRRSIPVLQRMVDQIDLPYLRQERAEKGAEEPTDVCIDGFVIEVPDPAVGRDVGRVGDVTRAVLQSLSDHDPAESGFMECDPEGSTTWTVNVCKCSFFLTVFAPCYPASHPRHTYGSTSTFMLFQPEHSFRQRKIPVRAYPKTARWKIRENFYKNGQGYNHNEPMWSTVANWFVRPLDTGEVFPPAPWEEWKWNNDVSGEFPNVRWWDEKETAKHYTS